MEPEGTCSACQRPIWWGLTEYDKRMPVDPSPRKDGRVVRVHHARTGKVRLHVLTGAELPWQEPEDDAVGPYMPHHVTCPHADQFRPPGGRRRPPKAYAHALTCRACGTRMSERLTAAESTSTHPCCDPTDGVPRALLEALGYRPAASRPAPPPADTLNIPETT